jgi:hypothetical protein
MKTFLLALVFAATLPASTIYQFSLDTSSVAGTAGVLAFQFNPSGGADPATAIVSLFASDGTIGLTPPTYIGDASGTLGTFITLGNSTAWNEADFDFTAGTSLFFQVELNIPVITQNVAGSSFGFSFFSPDFSQAYLTADPSGFIALIDLNADGTATPTAYNGVFVPEPGTFLGAGLALAALHLARRLRHP